MGRDPILRKIENLTSEGARKQAGVARRERPERKLEGMVGIGGPRGASVILCAARTESVKRKSALANCRGYVAP